MGDTNVVGDMPPPAPLAPLLPQIIITGPEGSNVKTIAGSDKSNLESAKSLGTEEVKGDEEGKGEGKVASQNTTSLKTLNSGHATIQAKLQKALAELNVKQKIHKDLKKGITHQKEKARILQEGSQTLSEKIFWLKTSLDEKEGQQENLFRETADAKWKVEKTKEFLNKLKSDREDAQKKATAQMEKLRVLEDPEAVFANKRKELLDYVSMLQKFKKGLAEGDEELLSILNGTKKKELEEKMQSLKDSMDQQRLHCDTLYVTLDEKTEQVEQKKKSLEKIKEQHGLQVSQLQNQLKYLRGSEARIQPSLEYLQQKIDYGMRVPAASTSTSNWVNRTNFK